ncbi:hypothetical protein [Kribbella sp. VKM Ac-2568]|uniref:hypothetical protein n=1 Tax=Kribbella sp. VKM Ac-2568 TaxID=2512219 RepID=UPI00104E5A44|nr:hypothetical protein [Kribbella sp. VKM Ac-2568]
MDLQASQYNDMQISDLERLVKELPGPSSHAPRTPPERRRSRTAKQLNADESAQLIARYEAGAKLRELGTQVRHT